jgi:eukaryotic-like serine/threonine-protein kinase
MGHSEMKCSNCGQDISAHTLPYEGVATCPNCGHSIALPSETETQTYRVENPLPKSLKGRFVFKSYIGRGTFGIVYRAWDATLHREVAIKVPVSNVSNNQMFLREARAASHLRHPNIVTIYDVILDGSSVSIISDFIEGVSMRSWLEKNPLSQESVCKLMITLANAIEYANSKGIIHRDLKPGNIVMSQDNVPHVLDFGLSQSYTRNLSPIGKVGQAMGTPAFMAPEQVLGDHDQIGPHTDCYALGVILYQLLTGRLPFHGSSTAIFQAILNTSPEPIAKYCATVSPSLEAICQKAMAKSLDDRFSSAGEMATELQRFLRGDRVHSYTGFDSRRAKKLLRRNMVGASAVALAGLLGGTYFWNFRSWRSANPIRKVRIGCSEPNAKIIWKLIDKSLGDLSVSPAVESRPNEWISLSPGLYRVRAELPGDYCEYFRTVPSPDASPHFAIDGVSLKHRVWEEDVGGVELAELVFVPQKNVSGGMSYLPSGSITASKKMGSVYAGTYQINAFLMDVSEVTNTQLLAQFPTLAQSGFASPPNSPAATNVQWDVAIAYAEAVGKSLPTIWEYLWAATNGGQTQFPWGNDSTESTEYWMSVAALMRPKPVAPFDVSSSTPPLTGLFSSVGEWTETPAPRIPDENGVSPSNGGNLLLENHVVGVPSQIIQGKPPSELRCDDFGCYNLLFRSPYFGFRCVRRT